MSHIFISYASADCDFSELLELKLKENNFEVWRDSALTPGDVWTTEIEKGIKEAFALIVVVTPSAKASEFVTYEWAYAFGCNVKVVPLLRTQTVSHPRLSLLQYADFTNPRARPWGSLFEILRDARDAAPERPVEKAISSDLRKNPAYGRMIDALRDERWTWRTLKTLSAKAKVDLEKARELLAKDSNVKFGRSKDGLDIAALKSKLGGIGDM